MNVFRRLLPALFIASLVGASLPSRAEPTNPPDPGPTIVVPDIIVIGGGTSLK